MGIQGLLPFLKDATEAINIRKYKGHSVAIDTYCWIHRGAVACALQLAKGEKCDQYVRYCLKFVNLLRSLEIKPVLVFDGRHLPAKKSVEDSRRKRREVYRQKGKQLLREGKASEARDAFVKCINVTSEMALEVMKAARSLDVDCIVAPYEADAQLAYLERNGFVQAIITEDSDLLAFGCKRVIFKMDTAGNALEIDQSRLNTAVKMGTYFSVEKFRHMCILAGCDYLASLPGIGLGKARKFIHTSTNPDIRNVLKRIPLQLKLKVPVTAEYIDGFIEANRTFLYQLAFDPQEKKLMPLNPYPPELADEEMNYAGSYLDSKTAMELALGNIELDTMKKVFDFTPEFRKQYPRGTPRHKFSIWHDGYRPAPPILDAGQGDVVVRKPTKGQEVIVPSNRIVKIRTPKKRRREDDINNSADRGDLSSMYGGDDEPDAKMARVEAIEVIPETPSPLKKLSQSPARESRSPIQAKPRMTPRNVFAVKKGHRLNSATRRDMLNSEQVSSRFFKNSPKPEEEEDDQTGTEQAADCDDILNVSNHEGKDHIYERPKVHPVAVKIEDDTNEGLGDCIRDHQRKVRATTGRLCDRNVDRTSVLDSLQQFRNSSVSSEFYEEQVRIKKEKELQRKTEEERFKRISPQKNKTSSRKHPRQGGGAFSWSKKRSPTVQKTLGDSVKSLGVFHRTSKSPKSSLRPARGKTPEDSESGAETPQEDMDVSKDPLEDIILSQISGKLGRGISDFVQSQQSDHGAKYPTLNSQHSVPNSCLDSQRSAKDSQEGSKIDSQHLDSSINASSQSSCFDSQRSARDSQGGFKVDSRRSNVSSVPFSQKSLDDCSIDQDGPTFSQITRERQESRDEKLLSQSSSGRRSRNPFRKVPKAELTPDDDELCDLLDDIAADDSFVDEEKEHPESSLTEDVSQAPGSHKMEIDQNCDSNGSDDVLIVSVTEPSRRKSPFGSEKTPALPSLRNARGPGSNDENSPPRSRKTGRQDGETVSSYFTKSNNSALKSKGSCRAPGLSRKKKSSVKNPSSSQQPTLMSFIKKKDPVTSNSLDKSGQRAPLSPTKFDENVTPESESVFSSNKSLAVRKSIFK